MNSTSSRKKSFIYCATTIIFSSSEVHVIVGKLAKGRSARNFMHKRRSRRNNRVRIWPCVKMCVCHYWIKCAGLAPVDPVLWETCNIKQIKWQICKVKTSKRKRRIDSSRQTSPSSSIIWPKTERKTCKMHQNQNLSSIKTFNKYILCHVWWKICFPQTSEQKRQWYFPSGWMSAGH